MSEKSENFNEDNGLEIQTCLNHVCSKSEHVCKPRGEGSDPFTKGTDPPVLEVDLSMFDDPDDDSGG